MLFHGATVEWECQSTKFSENIGPLHDLLNAHGSSHEYAFEIKFWLDFDRYRNLCHEFSKRYLRCQKDGLKAFSSMTTPLSTSFPGGFVYALPECLFSLALS